MAKITTKKPLCIIIQLCSILMLCTFFVVSIFVLSQKDKQFIRNETVYKYEQFMPHTNTTQIYRSNITKFIRLYGEIKRIASATAEILVPNGAKLNCVVGSIINAAFDIFDNNLEDNFAIGRVIDILISESVQTVVIDLASNYVTVLTLDDSYGSVIEDIKNGTLCMDLQIGYAGISTRFIQVEYNKQNCQFILTYALNQLNRYVYPDMSISGKIIEKEYKNAILLDVSAIKDLTKDFRAIVDMIIVNDGHTITKQEVEFQIIDTANNKIIINASEYIGSNFIVYDIYQAINI